MQAYLNICKKVLQEGYYKEPSRKGLPPTIELFGESLKFSLKNNILPILTCKRMPFKTILTELLWFLRGDYNIQYLHENNCHIWDQDGYRYYLKANKNNTSRLTFEEYSKALYNISGYMGKIYGYQWRNWEGEFDQIYNLVKGLIQNPFSRYHVVTAWNPNDFLNHPQNAALPACHMIFQCNVRVDYKTQEKILDLSVTQRSCDLFLGVPFNITSYSILIYILCHITGYTPGNLIWNGNSVHIYVPHIPYVKVLISNNTYDLPLLVMDNVTKFDLSQIDNHEYFNNYITSLDVDQFKLQKYLSEPSLKAPLFTGLFESWK